MRAKKLGVFGGTFDPIHRGHVEPVRRVAMALGLHQVLFIPTAKPPHKDGPRKASALHRYVMVELALLDEPDFVVSPLEMPLAGPTDPPGPSYTVDTLERLRREHPNDALFLIVGADSFVQLSAWRNWSRILRLAELAVMTRPGWSLDEHVGALPAEQRQAVDDGRVYLVENPPVDLSSSEIRRMLRRGVLGPADALHPRVLRYAHKYGLYRQDSP